MNSENQTIRLVKVAGVLYIGYGLLELVNYVFHKPMNLFQLVVCLLIGVGLFTKFGLARILGIIVSVKTVLLTLAVLVAGAELSVIWMTLFAVVPMIIHSILIYILLRNDVSKLFSAKVNKIHL